MTTPTFPVQRRSGAVMPDHLWVNVPQLTEDQCKELAVLCAARAKAIAPKVSGQGARGIKEFHGKGYFGLRWDSSYLWYVESGTKPHTLRSIAGKTVPMWLPDPLGRLAHDNPKAKTRITEDGRKQTLIFRRAAKMGQHKDVVKRDSKGRLQVRQVPASYPGAAGRINLRRWPDFPGGTGTNGRIMSTIARPHIGVRWRHPGIVGKHFMAHAITSVCFEAGIGRRRINATYKKQ